MTKADLNIRSASYQRGSIPRLLAWSFVAILAIAAIVLLRTSDSIESLYLPKCSLHSLTGMHCTGCGATRAMHALVHGDIAKAWTSNPLLVVGMPILGVVWGWRRLRTWHGNPPKILAAKWIWLIFAVLVVFGVLRNVPYYPFTLLAPH